MCIRDRAEIYNAEDKTHALAAARAFAADYGAKWPKAVAKVIDDLDVLLAFYDYPAEHWIHPVSYTHLDVYKRQPQPSARPRVGSAYHRCRMPDRARQVGYWPRRARWPRQPSQPSRLGRPTGSSRPR